MIYERLIHEYLDNELDQAGEEALFAHLSKDELLRAEFNRQRKLINLAKKDMMSVTVPSSVSSAVFSNLGFALPTGMNIAEIDGGKNSRYKSKYLAFMFLVLFIFTAGTTFYLVKENSELKNILSGKRSNNGNYPVMSSVEEKTEYGKNIPDNALSSLDKSNGMEIFNNSSVSVNGNAVNSSRNRQLNITQNPHLLQNSNEVNESIKNSSVNSIVNVQMPVIFVSRYNNNQYSSNNINESLKNMIGTNGLSENMPFANVTMYNNSGFYNITQPLWSVQFRRLIGETNFPPASLAPENNSINDYSFGIWYNYSPVISFGMEFGNEMFSQKFTSEGLNYSQSPVFFWAGVSGRYAPNDLIITNLLNPYISQTLAYTKVGPLSKTQIGLTLNPYSTISFFAGVDLGVLLYNADGALYNSGKIGWTGGVNINFR